MNSTAICFFVTKVIVEVHRSITDCITKSGDSVLNIIPVKETPLVSIFEWLDTKCLDARPDFKCRLPRGVIPFQYFNKFIYFHILFN